MKTFFNLFTVITLLFSMNSYSNTITKDSGEYYAVIATTSNGYQSYSINLRVEATCYGNSCTISGVEVASNGGYSRVSYAYAYDGKYSINHDGYTYYFRF